MGKVDRCVSMDDSGRDRSELRTDRDRSLRSEKRVWVPDRCLGSSNARFDDVYFRR
jgi:hypothetical protein